MEGFNQGLENNKGWDPNKNWSDEIKKQNLLKKKIDENLESKNRDFQDNILDPETKSYIADRFPNTNDDNLREEYSKNLIVGDGYEMIEKHHDNHESVGNIQKSLNQELFQKEEDLNVRYEDLSQKYKQQENIEKDFRKLLDLSRVLHLSFELSAKSNLNLMKSAENKEQERYILESEIEKLKSEISEISESKNIKEEEYVRLHKIYEDLYQRYEDFKKLRFTDRPDLN